MKGTARMKQVATSGSLTGKGKVPQSARRRKIPNPGLSPCPDPSVSLYSTESEDQVASLHVGLDRCAALINDILQSETSDFPGPHTALKGRTTVRGPGVKHLGNTPGKTVKKAATQTVRRGAGSSARGKQQKQQQQQQQQQCVTPVQLHKGVKLHLSRKQTQPEPYTLSPLSRPAPPPQSVRRAFDGDGDAPVRDVDAQRPPEAGERVPTVHSLLGELRSLIAGEGSVAEILLGRLERMMLLPLTPGRSAASKPNWTSLQTLSAQHQRHERPLGDEQLKQKETVERLRQDRHSNTEVSTLQEELAATRLQLQEARNEVAEVRRALEVTQSQLRDKEAASALVLSELEAARSQLLNSEREKSRLASLAQRRLEDGERLNRLRNARDLPNYFPKDGVGVERQTSDCVTNYLMSLEPVNARPTDGENPSKLSGSEPCRDRPVGSSWRPLTSTLFGCEEAEEEESVMSDLSSTFNTRDEAAFKDGLSALDASIASLQKTIQLDLAK
ncbi:putative ATP-dependent RNA helicase DDX4 isoform X2 [Nelusetta ayraudi]|uniref:putative ATP-dependent RNA helicase DDX4 isoform X2 n=1 Tax=Nelusetta ayraudi TaxID=303726 RepID=UPI003F71E6FF